MYTVAHRQVAARRTVDLCLLGRRRCAAAVQLALGTAGQASEEPSSEA